MRRQHQWGSVLMAAMLSGLVGVTVVAAAGTQFLPILGVREGALRSQQIPLANGFIDYVTLLNERDGGINGVTLVWEECETVYDVTRGVECYERLKTKGPTGAAAFSLFDTPLVNALIERATHDQIPLLAGTTGRSDAADGRVFLYVFKPPITFWSLNTAKLRFIGQRAGGMDAAQGPENRPCLLDNDYGRETLPILDTQAAQYGFTVQHLAVPTAGARPEGDLAAGQGRPARLGHPAQPRRHDHDGPEGSGPGRHSPATRSWGQYRPVRSRIYSRPARRPWASSARPGPARGDTSRSSRTSSPPSMPGAKGLVRKGMSARGRGCGACSPQRQSARLWANLGTSP